MVELQFYVHARKGGDRVSGCLRPVGFYLLAGVGLGGRDEAVRRHNREVLCRLRRRLVEAFDEAAGKV